MGYTTSRNNSVIILFNIMSSMNESAMEQSRLRSTKGGKAFESVRHSMFTILALPSAKNHGQEGPNEYTQLENEQKSAPTKAGNRINKQIENLKQNSKIMQNKKLIYNLE